MQILSKAAKEGPYAAVLLDKCRESVKLGRMSGPFRPEDLDLDTVVLSTRFGVSQGDQPSEGVDFPFAF